MNKLIILDLDGTLVDCKELHQTAFREAIGQDYPLELVEGLPTLKKIEVLNERGYDLDSISVNRVKQEYTFEHIGEYVDFNPRLKRVLGNLMDEYTIAICSNATRPFVERCVDILGIRDNIRGGIYTASENVPKPSIDMWSECIGDPGSWQDIVIFEDSPVGIMGAERIKLIIDYTRVVAVEDSADTVKKLKEL